MNQPQYGTWTPYAGSGAIILALGLLVIVGILGYLALRLRQPLALKRPGTWLRMLIIVCWFVFLIAFPVAITLLGRAYAAHAGSTADTPPSDPIAPVTAAAAVLTFFVIVALTQRQGAKVAVGSGLVGTIAAGMIFEFPFDLIVMGRIYPPTPFLVLTVFFGPLILLEFASFALLALSPATRISRPTLLLLAGMFLIFAVWALFGFAYPSAPLPIVLNMVSKVLAFAVGGSLFLPQGERVAEEQPHAQEMLSECV